MTEYDNPLVTRYASRPMVELWGPQRKHSTWRRLWLALAESLAELGLTAADGLSPRVRPEQLAELRDHLDDIDFARATFHEKRLRHDVMAHIHTLGVVAPEQSQEARLRAGRALRPAELQPRNPPLDFLKIGDEVVTPERRTFA